jgi:hypothetical protein
MIWQMGHTPYAYFLKQHELQKKQQYFLQKLLQYHLLLNVKKKQVADDEDEVDYKKTIVHTEIIHQVIMIKTVDPNQQTQEIQTQNVILKKPS